VIADRLTLSTACLLALLHHQPVDHYVRHLADVTAARPQLTVLLTTPPPLCHTRLARRATPRRFAEDPATASHLAGLYQQAATSWTEATGLPVLRHPCTTDHDLDTLVSACLDRLRETARTTPPAYEEPDHAPASTAPRRLGP
jgi:dTMP kinase